MVSNETWEGRLSLPPHRDWRDSVFISSCLVTAPTMAASGLKSSFNGGSLPLLEVQPGQRLE
jgi:hypothetical protein